MSVSVAHIVLAQAEAGQQADFDAVPVWQWEIWYSDLRRYCPDTLEIVAEPGFRNRLTTEFAPQTSRCKKRSPDGRGAAWLLSGGSALAYGQCSAAMCPRALAAALGEEG
jgi:hypothetical protein